MTKEELKNRGNNRSQQPHGAQFRDFIGSNWGPRPPAPERAAVADYLPARHHKLSERFPGERLVIPAGGFKVRNNDCDYRFRAHSAFAHMTGLVASWNRTLFSFSTPRRTATRPRSISILAHPAPPKSFMRTRATASFGWAPVPLSPR